MFVTPKRLMYWVIKGSALVLPMLSTRLLAMRTMGLLIMSSYLILNTHPEDRNWRRISPDLACLFFSPHARTMWWMVKNSGKSLVLDILYILGAQATEGSLSQILTLLSFLLPFSPAPPHPQHLLRTLFSQKLVRSAGTNGLSLIPQR